MDDGGSSLNVLSISRADVGGNVGDLDLFTWRAVRAQVLGHELGWAAQVVGNSVGPVGGAPNVGVLSAVQRQAVDKVVAGVNGLVSFGAGLAPLVGRGCGRGVGVLSVGAGLLLDSLLELEVDGRGQHGMPTSLEDGRRRTS